MSDVEAQGALPTSSPPGLARVPIVPSGGVLVGGAPCWFYVKLVQAALRRRLASEALEQ